MVRDANERWLYAAQLFSQCADWMKTVVLIGVVYQLAPSVGAIGGLFLASFVPGLLGTRWIASFLEQGNKKGLLVGMELLRVVTTLGIAGGVLLGELGFVYGFVALSSWLSAAHGSARTAFVSELFSEQKLVRVGVWLQGVVSAAMVVGGIGGGWLAEGSGSLLLLGVVAHLYLLAAACLCMVVYLPTARQRSGARVATVQHLQAGFRMVRSRKKLFFIYLLQGCRDLCVGAFCLYVAYHLWARGGDGYLEVGVAYALIALSSLVGTLLFQSMLDRIKVNDPLFLQFFGWLHVLYAIALGVLFSLYGYYAFFVLLFGVNLCQALLTAMTEALLKQESRPDVRSNLLAGWLFVSRTGYGAALVLGTLLGVMG